MRGAVPVSRRTRSVLLSAVIGATSPAILTRRTGGVAFVVGQYIATPIGPRTSFVADWPTIGCDFAVTEDIGRPRVDAATHV